ncbi:hypothetical protein M422DRAFT_66430 [Sphaerobolus stellatus SS14]|uniref:JmjC domain-containing protein n=1 Tax=Sphaerobolus stellatus (strain SS14) TaxID=990650 RepID=A0A0C9W4M3_SPHS4|nr:hypothetical protein M422DRAFT_66430 [Sphaerobolus stellatus SS14]
MPNVDSIPIIIGEKVKLTVDHQDYLWNRYIATVLLATNDHEVLLGDICVVTVNPSGFLNNENIPHDIYVRINNYAWKPLSDCRHSNIGKEKFAMHPTFGHKILFNLPRLLWQHKSNIQELVKRKQAASHPPSPSRLPSPPRKVARVEGGSDGSSTDILPGILEMPVLKHLENQWLLNLYQAWVSPPLSKIIPTHQEGKMALLKVLEMNQIFPQFPNATSNIVECLQPESVFQPDLDMALADLMASADKDEYLHVINYSLDAPVSKATPYAIIASMLAAPFRTEYDWAAGAPLYGTLTVPFSNKGLGQGEWPYQPYENSPQFALGPKSLWTSVITPPGAITNPHVDDTTCSHFFTHIHGRKLWFLWPWTPANADLWVKHHTKKNYVLNLAEGLEHLEGLELLWMDGSQRSFSMPPHHFHACISFEVCAHASLPFWGIPAFDDAEQVTKHYLWKALKFTGSDELDRDLGSFFSGLILSDFGTWRGLAEECGDLHLRNRILDWVKAVDGQIDAALRKHPDAKEAVLEAREELQAMKKAEAKNRRAVSQGRRGEK